MDENAAANLLKVDMREFATVCPMGNGRIDARWKQTEHTDLLFEALKRNRLRLVELRQKGGSLREIYLEYTQGDGGS